MNTRKRNETNFERLSRGVRFKAMGLLLGEGDEPGSGALETRALLINLVLDKRNAQLLAGDQGQGLRLLVESAFAHTDPLILKILKNVASHDGPTKAMFVVSERTLGENRFAEDSSRTRRNC